MSDTIDSGFSSRELDVFLRKCPDRTLPDREWLNIHGDGSVDPAVVQKLRACGVTSKVEDGVLVINRHPGVSECP